MILKPCPICDKPPLLTMGEDLLEGGKTFQYWCSIHLSPRAEASSLLAAEKDWNDAVDRYQNEHTPAHDPDAVLAALNDIARELAAFDANYVSDPSCDPAPGHPTDSARAYQSIDSCYEDLSHVRVAVTKQDWSCSRRHATRLAAHAVRLMLDLPRED